MDRLLAGMAGRPTLSAIAKADEDAIRHLRNTMAP